MRYDLDTARVRGPEAVQRELEKLARICAAECRGRRLPPLYRSGVVYRREPPGRERWQSAVETLRVGGGDCEDLVAWRVGELRARGVAAQPHVYRVRPGLMHCVVMLPGGRKEDPSKRLGMRGRG